MYANTRVLNHFNIEKIATDVPINKKILLQLPDCFIAQINNKNGNDLILVEKKEKTIASIIRKTKNTDLLK